MKIVNFILTVTILLLPLGELGRFTIWNEVAFSLNDFLIGLTVGTWLFLILLKKIPIPKLNKIFSAIGIFAIVASFSLIINIPSLLISQTIISSFYLVRWVCYALLCVVISGIEIDYKKRLAKYMLLSGFLFVLGGYLQYFLYPDLRNLYYAGWDEHLYRMFSSFLDPNFAGVFFVLFSIFCAGKLFSLDKKDFRQKKEFYVLGFILVLTIIAAVLTYSRTALIMLTTAIVVLFTLKKSYIRIFLMLVFLVIGIGLSAQTFKSEGTNILRIASTQARVDSAKKAITIFLNNPILGAGFNSYRYAQIRYGVLSERRSQISHSSAGTDNSFLFVLATTGLIGFSSFLFVLYKIIMHAFETDFSKNTASLVLITSLISLVIGSLFINALFYTFIMEWFWILVGLSIKTDEVRKNKTQ